MNVDTVTGTTISKKRERLAAYRAMRRRATEWLLAQMNPDGSIGDPRQGFFFYRGAWSFSLVGETEAASAICGWIRRNMLQSDGTIGGPYRVLNDAWAYRDSALIVGAHMAGQYDLSRGLMEGMLRWQDPISGGFANDRMPDGSMSDDQSIPYAAGPGFACLATGHWEGARAVYRFLQRIYDAQTELPERFYYDWSRSRQAPTTEYSEEKQFWYVVENQVARLQRWTIGGIAAAFSVGSTWRSRSPSTSSWRAAIRRSRCPLPSGGSITVPCVRAAGAVLFFTSSQESLPMKPGAIGWATGS